jgi:tetratricopeptide (TPR) repeat protein
MMGDAGGALLRQAVAQHQSGKLPQAIAAYQQVLAADPRNADALHLLGVALAQAGQPADAVPLIERALERYPNSAQILLNLANALGALQRHAEALASYQRAARLAPQNAAVHGAVCRAALMVGNHAEALASSERALRLQPNDFGTLLNRATSLIELDRLAEALSCCDRALALTPDHWGVHIRKGVTLAKLGRDAEAEVHLARGVALDPTNAAAHYDLGNLYGAQRRHELALASFTRALELRPDYPEARWNVALLRLLRGEFLQGWALYEERFAMDKWQGAKRRFDGPQWSGREPLAGKRILLWAERGLGDMLQFSRYATLVRDRAAEVVLEVHARLGALLEDQFPGVKTVALGTASGSFDYHCPLLSLPHAFGTELDTIPADVPYLKADPVRIERWSRRLPPDDTLRIGIAWQGNPDAERNWARGRSWSLSVLEPLAREPGVSLVSLQTGPSARQLESVSFADRIVSFGEALDAGPDAFVDTAAVMMNLDLIICSDTSVAHLAGALGVPVWVALHTTSEWRWLLERSDCPWYPSMRLFRQRTAGRWDEVVVDLCRAVRDLRTRDQSTQLSDSC